MRKPNGFLGAQPLSQQGAGAISHPQAGAMATSHPQAGSTTSQPQAGSAISQQLSQPLLHLKSFESNPKRFFGAQPLSQQGAGAISHPQAGAMATSQPQAGSTISQPQVGSTAQPLSQPFLQNLSNSPNA
ncbi:MAG: hypothetical protein AAGJ83_08290 [Planctomycetota bacterium]